MPSGVIHDIGYQRYEGPRLGRGYATVSLYVHGVRTAFGLGRSAKAKIFPWAVVAIVTVVAVVLTAIRSQLGKVVVSYLQFPGNMTFLVILFCAAVAPELVSRDLRSGVLPLYFSRPLSRADYALAKLTALVTAVWLLLAGPQLVMFLGGVFTVKDGTAVWHEVLDFLPGLALSALYAVVFGSVALVVASLASRRAVAAAVIVAVFVATAPVVAVLSATGGETAHQLALLASPSTLVRGFGAWLFTLKDPDIGSYGPLYGVVTIVLVVVCVAGTLIRYRKVAR